MCKECQSIRPFTLTRLTITPCISPCILPHVSYNNACPVFYVLRACNTRHLRSCRRDNQQPTTIVHRPCTINHRPCTINDRPSTIDHGPCTHQAALFAAIVGISSILVVTADNQGFDALNFNLNFNTDWIPPKLRWWNRRPKYAVRVLLELSRTSPSCRSVLYDRALEIILARPEDVPEGVPEDVPVVDGPSAQKPEG